MLKISRRKTFIFIKIYHLDIIKLYFEFFIFNVQSSKYIGQGGFITFPVIDFINFKCKLDFYSVHTILLKRYTYSNRRIIYSAWCQSVSDESGVIETCISKEFAGSMFTFTFNIFPNWFDTCPYCCCRTFFCRHATNMSCQLAFRNVSLVPMVRGLFTSCGQTWIISKT